MLALVLLAKPILATLLQHGRFTAHDVDMAALSLSALSFGLPAFALVKVVAPAFYARQDTKTPVRAGVVAMIANMVMNIIFVGLLFALWHGPEDIGDGLLAAIAKVPGLHMGLALASALASYLNLAQLWIGLRRDGIYVRQPGWAAHLLRLGVSCAAMVAVLVAGLAVWNDWSAWSTSLRIARLAMLIARRVACSSSCCSRAGFGCVISGRIEVKRGGRRRTQISLTPALSRKRERGRLCLPRQTAGAACCNAAAILTA